MLIYMESLIPDELSLLPSCVSQVLDQGRIVEFDQPYLLLQSQASVFGAMVEGAGKSEIFEYWLHLSGSQLTICWLYMESLIPDELSLSPSCVLQVLDQGRIVEFDQPYFLLQSQASVFGVMVEGAGKSEIFEYWLHLSGSQLTICWLYMESLIPDELSLSPSCVLQVLDQGRIVEFDQPYFLLQSQASVFGVMVEGAGKSEIFEYWLHLSGSQLTICWLYMESLIPDELPLSPSCVLQVLDQGRIVEFDQPYLLLQSPGSVFGSMVEEAGKSEAAKLFAIAKTRFLETNPSAPATTIPEEEEDGIDHLDWWSIKENFRFARLNKVF